MRAGDRRALGSTHTGRSGKRATARPRTRPGGWLTLSSFTSLPLSLPWADKYAKAKHGYTICNSFNHGRRRAATSYSELWPHITAYDTPQLRKYYADGQSGTAKKKAPPRCQNSQVPRRGRPPQSAPSARRQPEPPTTKPTILPRGRRATPRKPNKLWRTHEHVSGVYGHEQGKGNFRNSFRGSCASEKG